MYARIIIVEDDSAVSDILSILLRRNGFIVEEYVTGETLMEGNFTPPDLFLLDKQLADMDGIDICRHLKNQPLTKDIPVIILSATPGLHKLVKESGADAFIEKPFTSRFLLSTIKSLLQPSGSSI